MSEVNADGVLLNPQEHLLQEAEIGRSSGISLEKLKELLELFYQGEE